MTAPKHIIFVLIDALRAANLSCYGYRKKTSPSIDRASKVGVLFENAFACTDHTDPSLTAIFTGKYPTRNGLVNHGELVTPQEVANLRYSEFLPEILKKAGYSTFAIDWLGRWHRRGYDAYVYPPRAPGAYTRIRRTLELPLYGALPSLRTPEDTTTSAISLIRKNRDKRFFLFLHYWDVHYPCRSPLTRVSMFYDGNQLTNLAKFMRSTASYMPATAGAWSRKALRRDEVRDYEMVRYDASIYYVDEWFGRLYNAIEGMGMLEDALIVVTSDHGESLSEHELYFRHCGLYDTVMHVPLIMKCPSLPQGKKIGALVQHLDLAPTILDLIGVNHGAYDTDGRSLLPLIEDRVTTVRDFAFMEAAKRPEAVGFPRYEYTYRVALRTPHYKFISSPPNGASSTADAHGDELYDLRRDAGETRNIAGTRMPVEDTLRDAAFLILRRLETMKLADKVRYLRRSGRLARNSESTYSHSKLESGPLV